MKSAVSALLVVAALGSGYSDPPEAEFRLRSGTRVTYPCASEGKAPDAFGLVAAQEYAERIATDRDPAHSSYVDGVSSSSSGRRPPALFDAVLAYVCNVGQPPARLARFPEPGTEAPDFTLVRKRAGGTDTVRLSQLRGQPVLLMFWGFWCTPCREEFPFLRTEVPALERRGIRVLITTVNEPEGVSEAWMRANGEEQLIVYSDPGDRTARTYLVRGIPRTYALDEHGHVITSALGRLDRVGHDSLLAVFQPQD